MHGDKLQNLKVDVKFTASDFSVKSEAVFQLKEKKKQPADNANKQCQSSQLKINCQKIQ